MNTQKIYLAQTSVADSKTYVFFTNFWNIYVQYNS